MSSTREQAKRLRRQIEAWVESMVRITPIEEWGNALASLLEDWANTYDVVFTRESYDALQRWMADQQDFASQQRELAEGRRFHAAIQKAAEAAAGAQGIRNENGTVRYKHDLATGKFVFRQVGHARKGPKSTERETAYERESDDSSGNRQTGNNSASAIESSGTSFPQRGLDYWIRPSEPAALAFVSDSFLRPEKQRQRVFVLLDSDFWSRPPAHPDIAFGGESSGRQSYSYEKCMAFEVEPEVAREVLKWSRMALHVDDDVIMEIIAQPIPGLAQAMRSSSSRIPEEIRTTLSPGMRKLIDQISEKRGLPLGAWLFGEWTITVKRPCGGAPQSIIIQIDR